ncbi:gluconeogenesis factor YvcK family protein [Sporosalibacterium faouarense]|uniref:gluconeogenesis factor YvcK family protein n=1 Tax=Sporosalibacterium faouarense TaxID=516123 RepID=UPI00141CD308|nr:gluconeogenesis factor YvcK family protein [Sporosalibacterium faouarense]MTI47316.1 YvcK family protein [Bacillota bacterium]
MSILKWLKPGLKIKRWVLLGIIGILVLGVGLSSVLNNLFSDIRRILVIDPILVVIGILLIIISLRRGITSVLIVMRYYKKNVQLDRDLVNELLYKDRILTKRPKIVVIGGGTGLSVLLRGLKEYTTNITAIVTVADDGGGSGILREDLGMLPPGDIRSCILALANTEPTMEKLLQYRFKEGKLKGQSFGNLFIAAMDGIYDNFEIAIKEMSNVLAVTGRVLPMTLEDVELYAKLKNGTVIKGESNIPEENIKLGSEIDKVFIKPRNSRPLNEALTAINEADCIVLGPGSLYTSVIPNLLVRDITYKIWRSKAIKVYIPNVMTQPGETDGYDVLQHVEAILRHSKRNIIDYVITNIEPIPKSTLNIYAKDGAKPIIMTEEQEKELMKKDIKVVKDKLIDIKKNYIRHDAPKVSEIIIDLVNKKRW